MSIKKSKVMILSPKENSHRRSHLKLFASSLLFLFFVLSISIASALVAAEPIFKRDVELSWDQVPGAKSYELEIKKIEKGRSGEIAIPLVKTEKTLWKGNLPPGKYTLRLRTYDDRGVAGAWSDPAEFMAAYPVVKMIAPKSNAQLKTKEAVDVPLKFLWQKIPGSPPSLQYLFELVDEKNQPTFSQIVEGNTLTTKLKVANEYRWRVSVVAAAGQKSDQLEQPFSFSIWGGTLDAPSINAPKDEFTTEINWSKPEYAKSYRVQVFAKRLGEKAWSSVLIENQFKNEALLIPEDWSPGNYRIVVIADAPLRQKSIKSALKFKLGDRKNHLTLAELTKPKSKEKSSKKTSGKEEDGGRNTFLRGTFLATSSSYESINTEKATKTTFAGRGFIGEMVLGLFYPGSWMGLLTSGEFDSFNINEKRKLFFAVDGCFAGRFGLWGQAKLMLGIGAFYKEIPSVVGHFVSSNTTTSTASANTTPETDSKEDNMRAMGPIINSFFDQPIFSTPLGLVYLGLTSKIYWNVYGLATPNKKKLDYRVSYRLGMLAGVDFSKYLRGLMGYQYQADRLAYLAETKDENKASFAKSGDVNEITMGQHHVSLVLEYWIW